MREIPPEIVTALAVTFIALLWLVVVSWGRRARVYLISVGNCHISAPTYDELVMLMKLALDTVEVHPAFLTTTEEENQHDQ